MDKLSKKEYIALSFTKSLIENRNVIYNDEDSLVKAAFELTDEFLLKSKDPHLSEKNKNLQKKEEYLEELENDLIIEKARINDTIRKMPRWLRFWFKIDKIY